MNRAAEPRAVAASVWRRRERVELQAAARFERLAQELEDLEAPAPVIDLAKKAASDEVRHATLCRELVAHFSGAERDESLGKAMSPSAKPVRVSGMTHSERVLYELVSMSCVTESLSTALLGQLVDQASDPLVRRHMHSILRDEVKHSQLGWAYLAAEHQADRSYCFGQYLPAMLSSTVQEELFSDAAEHECQDHLSGMGSLSRRQRRAVFVDVLNEVVFPGLERFGTRTELGRQWLAKRLDLSG